jgi:RNA polymerase sigma-70 factor (ECF subfamily)
MVTAVAPVPTSRLGDDRRPPVDPTVSPDRSLPRRTDSGGQPADANDWMRAVCEAHAGALLRYLTGLTLGERQTAEDLLQEVLLRAWRNRAVLTAEVSTLRPWLYTVARRVAIDNGRARAARPREVQSVDITNVPAPDETQRVVVAHAVRSSLARLSAAHRQVLVEVYYRRRPVADIARDLGVPEGTVKSRIYYALRAMRQAMDEG